jgi:hypothetical protein
MTRRRRSGGDALPVSNRRGPPQLGDKGSADVPSVELAFILSAHLGVVATVPFQIGIDQQTTGFEDSQLLLQYLALGSLACLHAVIWMFPTSVLTRDNDAFA